MSRKKDPHTKHLRHPSTIDRFAPTFHLWKDFHFEAAHFLRKVPSYHQCRRLHGHSYKFRIHCSGILAPEYEWVVDYAEIGVAGKIITDLLDHRNLNDVLKVETTAENLAWWIAERVRRRLPELSGIEVFETPTTSVRLDITP